jgi:hypothetical protein
VVFALWIGKWWPGYEGGLVWTGSLLLWALFCGSVAWESDSRQVRTSGFALATTVTSLLLMGWLLFALEK